MKNRLCLILAALFILAVFAGCGGNTTGAEKSEAKESAAPTGTNETSEATAAPAEEESSPYNLAAGKYEVNDEGYPTSKYEYELPISTTDEVFTHWTVNWTPQYLPEDGYKGLGMYKGMLEMTGMNIEYLLDSAATRSEKFSVLVNSDSLPDIMSQGAYFWTSGTLQEAVDDEYFANIYPYKDYMPNYLYQVYTRSQQSKMVKDSVFYKDDVWVSMSGFYDTPILNTGYMLRQDIMDELGLGNAHDVKTYDKLYEILQAFEVARGENFWPMMVYNTFEFAPLNWCGYSTTPINTSLAYTRVVDGKVQFCGTTDDDLELLQLLNKWLNEGIIDPEYGTYDSGTASLDSKIANDQLGCVIMTPSTVNASEMTCINPKCRYEPTQRLRKTEDQILKWGYSGGHITYGSCVFSAKCKNLPLVISFIDWWYSDTGATWTNWGPEGELWEYDENGERKLTELAMTHEAGTAWLQDCWCFNELAEAGIQLWRRNYAYEGGDRFVAMFDTWDVSKFYDGAYDWPTGVKFTDEQQQIIDENLSDPSTFFQENSSLFFTGEKPFSEWDAYVQTMMDMGLATVVEVYQEGYDEYMKS
jgi:putative aldouronate transport system substrate-binding protein